MKNSEVTEVGKKESQSNFSLDRERNRIRILKWMFGLLSLILLLSLIRSMIANQ